MSQDHNFKEILKWLNQPFVLIPTAIALWLSYLSFFPLDFTLFASGNIPAGEATAEGVNVGARVTSFYTAIFCFLALLAGGIWLWKKLEIQNSEWTSVYKFFAFCGILLLWFRLLQSPQPFLEEFLLTLTIAFSIYQFFTDQKNLKCDVVDFINLTSLAVGAAFLFKTLASFWGNLEITFWHTWYIAFGLLFFSRHLMHNAGKILLPNFARYLFPLYCVPLVLFLSREVYFIFNHYALYSLSPSFTFLLLLAIATLIWYAWMSKRMIQKRVDQKAFQAKYIFPVLLVGLVGFVEQQIYIKYPEEMFELANGANGVMRWFEFGEWPIVQALGAHVLSDIDMRSIYCLIFGYEGNLDFIAFDYLPSICFALVAYYFILKISQQAIFALLIAMLFPFFLVLIPGAAALSLITFFLLHQLLEKWSIKKLAGLMIWLGFLILWKIEVGLSSCFATGIVLSWFFAHHFDKKKVFNALIAVGASLALGVLAFVIIESFWDFSLMDNFRQAIGYFGANQAHAYAAIANDVNTHFQYHYFIFPLALALIGLYLMLSKPKINETNQVSIVLLGLLFLIAYYFFNAQRGLVRHGLIEGYDSFISSFLYLILLCSVYHLFKNKKTAAGLSVVVSIAIISLIKYPDAKGYESYMERAMNKFNEWPSIKSDNKKIHRVWGRETFIEERFGKLKQFVDSNLSEEQTFLDFTTNPMLYFHLQKEVPSYFNQYLQNTVTEELQRFNIAELQRRDVPIVLFSKVPDGGWGDNNDGVPNPIRFSALAHYIYQNYSPLTVLDDFYIWKRNDFAVADSNLVVDSLWQYQPKSYELGKYPAFLNHKTKTEEVRLEDNPKGRVFLSMEIENNKKEEAKAEVSYFSNGQKLGNYLFTTMPNSKSNTYVVPISTQYNWHQLQIDSIDISFDRENIQVVSSSLEKLTNEY